jgi:hypothetical protein
MLEAVQILSQRKRGPGSRAPRTVAKGAAPAVVLPNSLRAWSRDGTDQKALAMPGRHYRIITTKPAVTKGDVADCWSALCALPNSRRAYETVLKLAKGDAGKATHWINYLWRTSRLEVEVAPGS